MKTTQLLAAALTFAATGAAFAADSSSAATSSAPVAAAASQAAPAQQGLSREQVKAEFLEARRNGKLIETEADQDVAQTTKHYAK
ncbi:DUF4148 domain-containing protein [Massilia sp. BJB1822]|uniref:DUF4148 domain-containing protein n=1 Tax=Massilia sp. BJB1822 TaxID=2744470 RepID=UPI001592C55E|nr:DUF4148 domain-containing protein [Massilia sp. BJB1822]NVE00045.1 DUF4148 domain-containing protein [Massilia sp. BJB1822]